MNELKTIEEPMLAIIGRAASDPQVDVGKMRELLEMKKEIDAENAKRAFIQALHGFQSECPQISRCGGIVVNGQLRSRYSPYEKTLEVIRPFLQKWGFSESFDTAVDTKGQISAVTCTLSHIGGHSVQSTFPVTPDASGSKNGIQAIGSALSYGKRYSLGAVLGLVFTNEDDDGRATAMLEEARSAVAIKGAKPAVAEVSNAAKRDVWIAEISDRMDAAGIDDETLTRAINAALKSDLPSWTDASDKHLERAASKEGFEKLTKLK